MRDTASDGSAPPPEGWADCIESDGPDIFEKVRRFQAVRRTTRGDYSCIFRRPVLSATSNRVFVEDPESGLPREMIMMGSNSYLGLNSHPRVVEASVAAARKYGYGTGSVSLYTGTTDLHIELERRIARFYGCEDAILFPTGYAANVGTLSGILRKADTAVNDMFNHASIFDGCMLSGARLQVFPHRHGRRLQQLLERVSRDGSGALVVTDGVFSMEGDMADLSGICEIAGKFGAKVMVDEAHALGVVGPTGRGTAEACVVNGRVDITTGTLSKLPGGIGGYAAGSAVLVDYLRFYARPYFFSTSIPAPVIAGLIEVFNILENDLSFHRSLWQNIRYMVENLRSMGFDLGDTASAIVPIMVGEEDALRRLAVDLHREGIIMSYVAYPAVPKKRARLRMSLMSQHTREDLDAVLAVMEKLGKRHGLV